MAKQGAPAARAQKEESKPTIRAYKFEVYITAQDLDEKGEVVGESVLEAIPVYGGVEGLIRWARGVNKNLEKVKAHRIEQLRAEVEARETEEKRIAESNKG